MHRLIALAILLPTAAAAAPTRYLVDAAQSTVDVRLFKDGVASGLAHDHAMRARDVKGEVVFDPTAANALSMKVVVASASIEADPPEARKAYGLEPLDEDDRREIAKTMRGDDQLAVRKYPLILFESTAIRRLTEGEYRVEGKLTLHGVTREVRLDAKVTITPERFEGRGTLRLKQSDYGITPYSAALGAVKNKDGVQLVLHLVAVAGK
jgi:polyisoprenoid-binding protein YceI